MSTPTRIYVVTADDGEARLVRAASPAQAIRHVARARYRAHVAAQETLVEMLSAGDPVETAGDEPVAPAAGSAEPEPESKGEPEPCEAREAWPFPGEPETRSAAR